MSHWVYDIPVVLWRYLCDVSMVTACVFVLFYMLPGLTLKPVKKKKLRWVDKVICQDKLLFKCTQVQKRGHLFREEHEEFINAHTKVTQWKV